MASRKQFGSGDQSEIYGGKGGLDWDDTDELYPNLGVREFVIGYDDSVIISIKGTYEQAGGPPVTYQRRGGDGGTIVKLTFDYPNEYLQSVTGHYGSWSIEHPEVVIKSLTLKTNKKQYGPYGSETGSPFELSMPSKSIVGFRGRSGAVIDAIGAYYGPIPESKLIPTPAATATGGPTTA